MFTFSRKFNVREVFVHEADDKTNDVTCIQVE